VRFPTLHVSSSVWTVAKNLSQDHMSIMAKDSMFKLERMCMSGSLRTDYQHIIDCVLEWRLESKLLKMIQHYISINNTRNQVSYKQSNKGNKKRRVSDAEVPLKKRVNQAMVAISFLNSLLESSKSCKQILMKNKEHINSISTCLLHFIKNELRQSLELNGKDVDDVDRELYHMYLSSLFHTYSKLVTHIVLKPLKKNKFLNKKKSEQSEQVNVSAFICFI
jgi:hypothetical protein